MAMNVRIMIQIGMDGTVHRNLIERYRHDRP
jgi:hypothetical protein